ncbi:hypothetical protein HNQ93_000535 [Hymenobacter luteus]|uniref:Uncharacterized protein n=2 Tax=Hymenobacter TaxID=89966 RepID=A0A7W9SYH9_9BACT|nr:MULTISPECIES: hypothetical protein [Hymenobacter]MBB4599985.1 hypothetical protein [Hymenobacter latericoloratus]MBB6057705.1 hypothetical protein [Hymenobacter luteus]
MNSSTALVDVTSSKYQVGQVWKYKNRPNEDKSTVTVVKVELQHSKAVVVHVAVSKVKLHAEEPNAENEISHMPFSEDALDSSVTELLDVVVDLPDFEEGYETWKESFMRGEAGFFSVSVAQAVDFIDRTINSCE